MSLAAALGARTRLAAARKSGELLSTAGRFTPNFTAFSLSQPIRHYLHLSLKPDSSTQDSIFTPRPRFRRTAQDGRSIRSADEIHIPATAPERLGHRRPESRQLCAQEQRDGRGPPFVHSRATGTRTCPLSIYPYPLPLPEAQLTHAPRAP